ASRRIRRLARVQRERVKTGVLWSRQNSVQVLARRARRGLESALGLFRLFGALFPVLVEEAVYPHRGLGHLRRREPAGQERRPVLDQAAPLRLVDRVRRRSHEKQARFLLAVVVIERELDLDRLVAEGAQVLERGLERSVETPAGLAGPAQEQHQVLFVEAQA